MEKYGEATTSISPFGSTMYYLDNTPYGKLSVYMEFWFRELLECIFETEV